MRRLLPALLAVVKDGVNVTVLPGSFLSRTCDGLNPGAGFVRIALVAEEAEVMEAAHRIAEFGRSL